MEKQIKKDKNQRHLQVDNYVLHPVEREDNAKADGSAQKCRHRHGNNKRAKLSWKQHHPERNQ